MELYIFSQHEEPLAVLSEDTGLVDTHYRIEVNGLPDEPFTLTVESDHPYAKHIKDENKVVFKDHEGDWRLMTIKEVDDSNDSNGPITVATCEPTFAAELTDHMVVERRFVEQTADVALAAAVNGTRWQGAVEVELGKATTNFYYISSLEAIWKTIDTWGGELKDVVELDKNTNKIKSCYIKIIQRLGSEQGQRFEIDHNTTEIGRTVLSYPKTALYGRGSSLEIEDEDGEHTGGYTRYIDFGDIEWSVANGDPVDKPLGQKWVGDPDALDKYGILEDGVKRHRDGEFSNQDYEDPADLLQATWERLQDAKVPEVNYRLSVELFDKKVSLGDTCQAIDRKFARPIEIQARIIAMEYDLMDIEGTMVVEMGQFLDLGDNRLDDLEKEVEGIKNRPPKQIIDEGSYPNIKPGTPANVEAYGGMEVIQLYWEYASQIYVKHYEVYGSRTEDFIPDSQHLLWRGNTSAFAHTVGTDEVWYYRIRAVNYHGTPSDWSEQIRGATNRVLTEDILWGPELAERMRELHRVSDIIGENGVDFDQISQEAKDLINRQARIYTDEEIETTRDDILEEMGIQTERLDNRIADLYERADDLISRADDFDDILYDYNVRIDETERGLEFKADSLEVDQINRTIEGHTTEIELLAEGLRSKVSETFVRDAIRDIEIGGGNLQRYTEFKGELSSLIPEGWGYSSQGSNPEISEITQSPWGTKGLQAYHIKVTNARAYLSSTQRISVQAGEFITVSVKSNSNDLQVWWQFFDKDNNRFSFNANQSFGSAGKLDRYFFTLEVPENVTEFHLNRIGIGTSSNTTGEAVFEGLKVEKGNVVTSWSPAFEDIISVQEHHWTEITQNSRKIGLHAESITDIEGSISSAQASIEIMSDEINERVTKTIFDDESDYLRRSIAETRNFAEGIESTVSDVQIGLKEVGSWSRNYAVSTANPSILREQDGSRLDDRYTYEITAKVTGTGTTTTAVAIFKANDSGGNGGNGWTLEKIYERGITSNHPEFFLDNNGNPAIRLYNHTSTYTVAVTHKKSAGSQNQMTMAQSRITQLAHDISLKVDVDSIVSEININREGIHLSGALIHLDGLSLIDEAIIQNAHIANGTIERAKLARAIIGTAQIDDLAVTNAKIGNISADKLNAGAIRGIDVYGAKFRSSNGNNWMEIVGGDIHLEQSNGRYMDLSPTGLYGYNAGGSVRFQADSLLVTSRALGTATNNVYLAAQSGKEARVVDMTGLPSDGEISSYDYLPLRAQGIYAGFIENNAGSYGNNLYLRPRAGGEVRITGAGTTDAYYNLRVGNIYSNGIITRTESMWLGLDSALHVVNKSYAWGGGGDPIYRNIHAGNIYNTAMITSTANAYIGSDNELRVVNKGLGDIYRNVRAQSFFGNRIALSSHVNGIHFHVQPSPSGEVRITSRDNTGVYLPLRASATPAGSSEKIKENIVKYKGKALDLLNNSVIYEYNRIGIKCKRELGFIIERETPSEVLYDEESINPYSHRSLNTKAIQELNMKLDEEINWQRIEYQYLNNEVLKINDEITNLKQENKALKERVQQLEEMVA